MNRSLFIIMNCFLAAFLLATPLSASSFPAKQESASSRQVQPEELTFSDKGWGVPPNNISLQNDGSASGKIEGRNGLVIEYTVEGLAVQSNNTFYPSAVIEGYPTGSQVTINFTLYGPYSIQGSWATDGSVRLNNEKIETFRAPDNNGAPGWSFSPKPVVVTVTDEMRVNGFSVTAFLGYARSETADSIWVSVNGLKGNLPETTSTPIIAPLEPPTPTFTFTPQVERELTVTGYDGSDTYHTPLTFLIQAKENGKPLANEPLYFQFEGDVKCLMDVYLIWDEAGKNWIKSGTVSLAYSQGKNSLQTTTDSKGQVIMRVLLDLERMHMNSILLPCTETLKAGVARRPGDLENPVIAQATVTIRHSMYIQNVYFKAQLEPQPPSHWVPVTAIDTVYFSNVISKNYNGHLATGYPETKWILERVKINDQVFKPPADDRFYFSPVSTGSTLVVDMCNFAPSYQGYGAEMLPNDGIAVSVLWMDGTEAAFAQRNQDVETECKMIVKFDPQGWASSNVDVTPALNTFSRFAVNQVGDLIVKTGLSAGATLLGGPVAGAWTATVVEALLTPGDIDDFASMGGEGRMIVFRSKVSLTTGKDGLTTLYNFAGSPAVIDDEGNEVVPAPGEAVDFHLTGPVSAPEKREPPPEALELEALLAHETGFTALTFEELGLGGDSSQGRKNLSGFRIFLRIGAILLALGICFGIVFLIIRLRSHTGKSVNGGNKLTVWLLVGASVICFLCLAAAAVLFLYFGARQDKTSPLIRTPDNMVQIEETSIIPAPIFNDTSVIPPESTQSNPVEPQALPTATSAPSTAAPVSTATQSTGERTIQTYTDNFSSPSTGWLQLEDDLHSMGYSEGGMYGIGLKQAGVYVETLIPHDLQLPLTETSIYFRARPVAGKGYFGFLCDYVDEENTVLIGLTEGAYLVTRFINGEEHDFMATPWVYDPYIKSENGEFQIQISCGDTIEMMVNGYSLPGVDNPNRTPGDIAIFAQSAKKAVLDGYFYYQVLFDDMELNAR